MNKDPLEIINKLDNKLFMNVAETKTMTLEDGALGKKYKLLIALALDASLGTVDGVRSLAMQALENGASKEEILESIRVANFIAGVGCVYTAAEALQDIF
jgi:alkylhydroperoxidase/carboxymuconolactone decarboxylase family protein YurZ